MAIGQENFQNWPLGATLWANKVAGLAGRGKVHCLSHQISEISAPHTFPVSVLDFVGAKTFCVKNEGEISMGIFPDL